MVRTKLQKSVTKFWIRIKGQIDHIGILQTPTMTHTHNNSRSF